MPAATVSFVFSSTRIKTAGDPVFTDSCQTLKAWAVRNFTRAISFMANCSTLLQLVPSSANV
jgi:hypothetical protein